ncbi:MAG: methionine--tRNA ligase [DPANN group archaeon]|nr:methionine--tRNA ligase [DPANN group archaeon]
MIPIKNSKKRILITSALPYINNTPHLGNLIGSHLPADVFARFNRILGHETLFVGGSDEHGTPTEIAAKKQNITPKQLCDKYYQIHKDIYSWFNISYDIFSRTSNITNHKTTKDIFTNINKNGYIEEQNMEMPYCKKCNMYLPDRYVEGICPKCGAEKARGDQCDACTSPLNPKDLKKPYCIICNSTPEIKTVPHLFFRLDKIKDKWVNWASKKQFKENVKGVVKAYIKDDMKPRCITRDLSWGVNVPLKGYENKVFYVWFDAPIGYISATKEWSKLNNQDWEKWWKNKDTKIYHFLGKDNIYFHAVFWPSMLIADGTLNLPENIGGLANLNYEGGKFSKSNNRGIFCDKAIDVGYTSDIWRYYLCAIMPELRDSEFSWNQFAEKINSELVGNIGNFIHRTLTFTYTNFEGKIPKESTNKKDLKILNNIEKLKKQHINKMESLEFKEGLKTVLEISNNANRYFQESEPWNLIKNDKKRCEEVIATCIHISTILSKLLYPFIPTGSEKIWKTLGNQKEILNTELDKIKINTGKTIIKPEILFKKIEAKDMEKLKEDFSGNKNETLEDTISIEDFDKIKLKVGTIKSVNDHPKREKLYIIEIDEGADTPRQIVAGIKAYYKKEDLVGKQVIFVSNLKPVKLGGVESNGMIIAADDGKVVCVVSPEQKVENGATLG